MRNIQGYGLSQIVRPTFYGLSRQTIYEVYTDIFISGTKAIIDCLHRLDNIQRCGTKHLVFLIRQRHSRCDNNGVAGVDADRVKVFHRADRNLVADGIAHYLKLDLLPSGNTFLNQNLIDR